jgi:choice-of-anchor C domain-containing protein
MRLMRLLAGLLGLVLLMAGVSGHAAAASGPPSFTVTATADAEYLVKGGAITLTGSVRPAAPWQRVELQLRRDGEWQTVATAQLDAHSRYAASATLDRLGDQRLRVLKSARGAVGVGTSPVVTINVSSVQLSDDTVILTDEDTAHLVSYDPGSGRLEFDPGADVASTRVGTIFAAGFSERTPAGLLRRVTGIERTAAGGWVFGTAQATLSEAIVRTVGDEHVTGVLAKQVVIPARGVTVNGSSKRQSFSGSVPLPELSFSETVSASVSSEDDPRGSLGFYGKGTVALSGSLAFDSSAEFVWEQSLFSVDRARAAFHTSTTGSITASVAGELHGTYSHSLAEIRRFYIFPVGPVPVVIEDSSEVPFELDLSLTGTAEVSFSSTDTATAGFDYQKDNGGFSLVFEHDGDHHADADLAAEVGLEASLGLKDTFKVYGLAGVTGTLAAYGEVEADLDGTTCPLSAGLKMSEGVTGGIKVFGIGVEWEKSTEQKLELFRYDDCALNPRIETESLPDGTVGKPYSDQLALEEEREGYWGFEGNLPPGLSLGSDGRLSGTPERDGAYEIRVTFTDMDGRVGRTTLSLLVVPNLLVVTSAALPDGVVGVPYAATLASDGGTGPYTWTVLDGSVAGLRFNPDGSVTGQPTAAGSGTLTVQVVDADGLVGTGTVSWNVTDLPAPVPPGSAAGPIVPPPACLAACGTSWGDPHLVTWDGLSYDAQRVGELVLTKSTADDFEVQVRQQPWQGSQLVSVNTATAMDVNGDRVGIYLTSTGIRTRLDGEVVDVGATALPLPGGGSIRHDAAGRLEIVSWPDGTTVTASYVPGSYITLRLSVPAQRLGNLAGLLGDADGTRSDDLRARGGDVVPAGSPVNTVLTGFVDTWRISQAESLFDYPAGEDTASFTDPAFPYAHVTVADLPAAQADAAFSSCEASGVVGQAALDNCALDVALSGDPDLAAGALVMQSGTVPGEVAGNGSFEQPAIGSRFVSLGVGSTMGAWTVESGSVDLVHSSYWQPAAGSQSIDLNSCSAGRISQTMPVEPGQRYRIAYSYAGNPETSDRLKKFHVEVDGTVVDRRTFDTTGHTTQSMGWTSAVTAFVATGDRATISFQSDQPGSCGGAALDDIEITPVSTSATVIASSNPGDAWTDQSGASGLAELSYGHTGCTALDVALHCLGGGWAVLDDAPWIWAHQFTRSGEGPVTFTRSVRITEAQASHRLRLTALGDDVMTASVDGVQVLSGGFTSPTSADLDLAAGEHTLTFVVTNLGGYQPSNNPGGLAWKLRLA